MSILHLQNGRVICPAQSHDAIADLWLDDDRIGGFGAPPKSPTRVVYCRMFDKAVLVHAEILELTQGGVMNEGEVSVRLGLRGMPAVAEDIMIYRDIVLAELTGGKVHILHVSTAGGVDLIRQGRAKGI